MRFLHIGIAELEDNVQIGRFSMVARAAMERTLVEKDTKIGDYVQVAHNSTVGRHCMLAAYAEVGSGAIVEDHVFLGVRSSSRENIRIGRWAFIGQGALILEDVPPQAVMIGAPARFLRERERE